MTTLPLAHRSFNAAQTFFLDPSLVKNATIVGLSRIDLFFRTKPPRVNNKSGIVAPGVEVTIVPCVNGVPDTNALDDISTNSDTFIKYAADHIARKEWGEVIASTGAGTPTSFIFDRPIFVKSGREYAIVVKFDGNEDFLLWTSKRGNPLVGSTRASPGVSGPNVGNFYSFITPLSSYVQPVTANTLVTGTVTNVIGATNAGDPYVQSNWRPIADTDLKFKLYVARFFHNGVTVASNTSLQLNPTVTHSMLRKPKNSLITQVNGLMTLTAQAEKNEYVTYQLKDSVVNRVLYGEKIFQVAPFYPGGVATPLTVSVTKTGSARVVANASYVMPNGKTFYNDTGFNKIYSKTSPDNQYIIVKSGSRINVRRVTDVVSPTELEVDQPFSFTNASAYFFRAPVGKLKAIEKTYLEGSGQNMLTLYDTNANSSVRFVNSTVMGVSVTTPGFGYTNSDYLVIGGYEQVTGELYGGYAAYANIVTNGTGNVSAIYVSNAGAGFSNSAWLNLTPDGGSNVYVVRAGAQLDVANLSVNGLSVAITLGARLESEFGASNTYFGNCEVVNIPSTRGLPEITVENPVGTTFSIKHRQMYYRTRTANTSTGFAYIAYDSPSETDKYLKNFRTSSLANTRNVLIPSRSNQFAIRYANGALPAANVIGINGSNASVILFEVTSNNDFLAPYFDPEECRLHFSKYVVNDDYTDEHTNYGNAYSKHVTSKVSFGQDRTAEDLLVYLTAYRPYGTEVKVFARIHNSQDDMEAFDDKDWTMLDIVDGSTRYSSLANEGDVLEFTYGFAPYPNSAYTCNGSATVAQGNATVIGSGVTYNTELAVNDIVRIYDPTFPNNYFIGQVNNFVNASAFNLKVGLGDIDANLSGTASVNTTSPNVVGTSTTFLTDYANNGWLVVYDTGGAYDVRRINKVTSDTSMNVITNFSFANATSDHARLLPNTFINDSVTGSGLLVDKVAHPYQAFKNQMNEGVVRYYSGRYSTDLTNIFDGYNTFQLKIVMLSNNHFVVPKVEDVRAIGVSA